MKDEIKNKMQKNVLVLQKWKVFEGGKFPLTFIINFYAKEKVKFFELFFVPFHPHYNTAIWLRLCVLYRSFFPVQKSWLYQGCLDALYHCMFRWNSFSLAVKPDWAYNCNNFGFSSIHYYIETGIGSNIKI